MITSVYIHIPFCQKICSYCDFCKMYYQENFVSNYLLSLEKEVKKRYHHEKIKTLYIGGGTPSCLSKKDLNQLFSIINLLDLSNIEEFTFECNLNDITYELITFLKNNSVNRISIGIESFNKDNLKFMNRCANYNDALAKIKMIKDIGINNINVDLIYALPSEDLNILKSDIEKLISLDINHISTYSLMIENNTLIYNKGVKPIDEELDYKMYQMIINTLKESGFNHYEISNFAKPGFESKHNLVYWNNEHYYGFGLGSSGYINNIRYDNTKNLSKYLKGDYIQEKTKLSLKDIKTYELILGFRKTKGININEYNQKYNENIENISSIKKLTSSNDLIISDGYIFVNPDKLYIENEILVKLI